VKQKIQTKRLAISNVGKDSGKPTKIAAWEQATRDQMRIVSKAKDDADDWADLWRGRPRGFDALGLPIPVRRLGAKRLLIARVSEQAWPPLRANLAAEFRARIAAHGMYARLLIRWRRPPPLHADHQPYKWLINQVRQLIGQHTDAIFIAAARGNFVNQTLPFELRSTKTQEAPLRAAGGS
jgi:hypothetical protein